MVIKNKQANKKPFVLFDLVIPILELFPKVIKKKEKEQI